MRDKYFDHHGKILKGSDKSVYFNTENIYDALEDYLKDR